MKFKWFRHLSVVLTIAMLVSVMPVYAADATKAATVFHFVNEDDATQLSAAQAFFTAPAYTYEENGNKYFEITVPKVYDLTLTIENDPGEVLQDTASYKVFKFAVSAYETEISANTTYTIIPGGNASSHNVKLIIGNDITALKGTLTAEITSANQLTNRSTQLNDAIEAAVAANTYLTLKAVMETALANLEAAVAAHNNTTQPTEPTTPTPTPTPSVTTTPVTLSYINAEDVQQSYDTYFQNLIKQSSIYTKDRKTYLRITQKNTNGLTITVDGKNGVIVETDSSQADELVYDFVIASKTAPISATTSYQAGPSTHTFNLYIVIDQDAQQSDRDALSSKITEAEAVTSPSGALRQAIEAAKTDLNLLSRKVTLVGHITALTKEITNNSGYQATIVDVATLSYYKASDKTTDYNTSIGKYFSKAQVYEVSGKTFLRITQQNTVNLFTTINGAKGFEVEKIVNESGAITHFVLDFEITSIFDPMLMNVSYSAAGHNGSHDAYVVINQDATVADREALGDKLEEAKAVIVKDKSLSTAIELATADHNNVSRKATLLGHVDALTAAMAANDSILATLKAVTFNYVKKSDTTTSFDSSFASYFSDSQKYTVGEQKYIRVTVANTVNLKLVVEGSMGNIAQIITGDSGITHYTIDYAVSSFTNPIESVISYNAGGYASSHEQYIVIDQDADAASRTALADAITKAEAITNKGTALITALNDAKAVNNLLTRKAELIAKTAELTAAIAANSSTTTPPTSSIHEGSGLETGYYMVDVTVLKDNSDEESYMNGYVAGDARLLVTKNKLTVYIILTDASMIKSFSVGGRSASLVNNYTADNVARYSFEVSSLTSKVNGSVHVIATLPSGDVLYDTTHGIRLSFGTPTKVDKWEDEGYSKLPNSGETNEKEQTGTNNDTKNEQENNDNVSTKPVVKLNDIENSWAKAAINRAVSLGIVTGYKDGSFKPNQKVNRAEFTAILVRALKLDAPKGDVKFADANDIQGWAKVYVQQAVEAGILTGYQDNTFRPTGEITRADVAVMIVKALGLELVSADELSFTDANDIPAYARAYVATAVKYGLIVGYTNHTFGPTKVATRADAVTLALRALDYSEKKDR